MRIYRRIVVFNLSKSQKDGDSGGKSRSLRLLSGINFQSCGTHHSIRLSILYNSIPLFYHLLSQILTPKKRFRRLRKIRRVLFKPLRGCSGQWEEKEDEVENTSTCCVGWMFWYERDRERRANVQKSPTISSLVFLERNSNLGYAHGSGVSRGYRCRYFQNWAFWLVGSKNLGILVIFSK